MVVTLPFVNENVESTWMQSVNVPAGTVRMTLKALTVSFLALVPACGSAGSEIQVVPTEKVAGNITLENVPLVNTHAPVASSLNSSVRGRGVVPPPNVRYTR